MCSIVKCEQIRTIRNRSNERFGLKNVAERNFSVFLVDENEETNVEHLQIRVNQQVITPLQLQALNENYFYYILDRFLTFAKFVGRTCANRLIIDLN